MLAKSIPYGLPTTTIGVTADNATEVEVTALAGHFPVLAVGQCVYAVLSSDPRMAKPDANYETVKVIGPTPSSAPYILTIVRNQESTGGAREWPDGTTIACNGTAIDRDEIVEAIVLGSSGYGIRWVQPNDIVNRIGAAGGLARSDFDNISPWKDIRRCMLNDDGSVNYYIDPDDPTKIGEVVNTGAYTEGNAAAYDGTHGQVMVEIPKFYYSSGVVATNAYEYYVSDKPLTGYSVHPAFVRNEVEKDKIYFSAFEGFYSSADGAMRSVADVVPSTSSGTSDGGLTPIAAYPATTVDPHGIDTNGGDIRNCRYWAQQRGAGWEQQDFLATCALQLLYIVEYADWDTQSTIGKGVVDKSSLTHNNSDKTGATVSLGNTSGRQSGTDGLTAVSYRGVENFWGNIYTWVDGINVTGSSAPAYTAFVSDHSFESDKITSPYASIGAHVNTSAAWGNINNIAYNEGYSFLGGSVSGTSYASHLFDGFYSNTTGRVALFGGSWSLGSQAGGFCWSLAYVSSGVARAGGARLLFIG